MNGLLVSDRHDRICNMPGEAGAIHLIRLNDVEPQAYIAGVLDRLVNLWPSARIDELMPWAWAKAPEPDRLAA
jgi:hypothetical protein